MDTLFESISYSIVKNELLTFQHLYNNLILEDVKLIHFMLEHKGLIMLLSFKRTEMLTYIY